MDVDEASDGTEVQAPARAARADGFDDVFGSAIARAVRRAVDGVGRDPLGSLPSADEPAAPAAAVAAAEVAGEPEPEPADAGPPPLPAAGVTDPYELLGVSRRAPWPEINAAYKRRARAWHPDGAPEDEQARRHELIRDLNAAYAELRVRRGR